MHRHRSRSAIMGEAGASQCPPFAAGAGCPAPRGVAPFPTLGGPAPQTLSEAPRGQGQDAGRAQPGQKEQQARGSVPEAGLGAAVELGSTVWRVPRGTRTGSRGTGSVPELCFVPALLGMSGTQRFLSGCAA